MKTWAQHWADRPGRPQTRAVREHFINNLGPLAEMRVDHIRPDDIRTWHGHLLFGRPWANDTPLANATIAQMVIYLRCALNLALEHGAIARHPMETLRLGASTSNVIRHIPSIEELQKLIDANSSTHPWLARAIHLAATCGLRASEVAGLQHGDRTERGGIAVQRQCTRVAGEYGPLKTPAAEREVPLPKSLSQLIGGEQPPEQPVVLTRAGGGVSGSMISNAMASARKRAGVEEVTFHSFRHFYASHMLGSGVPLPAVARMLGHANSSVTARIYAHFIDGQETEARVAAEALAAKLGF